jgi:argininosuccinate lyase
LYDTVDQVCTLGEIAMEIGIQFEKAEMPGYTHMQRAMPTTLGLWGMGYAEIVSEDLPLLHGAIQSVNRSPLGSGAGYGVPYIVMPREQVAAELGFDTVQENVTSVQLSRGKIEMAVVHALLQVASTLNRMASDMVLFSSAEFRFIELPVEYSTGSSIMPQKRNPDVFELIRANYHRVVAEMNLLMTTSANLTSGYHRDLQLTKESVMRSCFVVRSMLQAMNTVLPVVRFQTERMKEACSDELYATAYAMKLVKKGMPFRTAYHEAAANKTGWSDERAVAGQTGYKVQGYPGRIALDTVHHRIKASRAKVAEYWG